MVLAVFTTEHSCGHTVKIVKISVYLCQKCDIRAGLLKMTA